MAQFSRSDYIWLASALRDEHNAINDPDNIYAPLQNEWFRAMVRRFADALKAENPQFDRERFYNDITFFNPSVITCDDEAA